jgi:hypothetical protein
MGAIDHFCSVKIPSQRRTALFEEADLKLLAGRLKTALARRSFASGEIFGSSTDLQAFTVEGGDVDVGISPAREASDDCWSVQVHLQDAGWFKSTREKRMAHLNKIEWAIHDALKADLGGNIVEWHIGPGRVKPGHGVATPGAAQEG